MGHRTDGEIALALVASNPALINSSAEIRKAYRRAKSGQMVQEGVPFDQSQVHRAFIEEAKKRRRVVTSPENPTPRVVVEDEDIGWGRGMINGWARGRLMGKQTQLMSLGLLQSGDKKLDRDDIEAITKVQKELQSIPTSEEFREYNRAEGFWDSLGEWASSPVQITSEAIAESFSGLWKAGVEGGYDSDGNYIAGKLPAAIGIGATSGAGIGAVGGAAGAGAGAGIGAAGGAISGMALTSHTLEATATYLDAFREAKVDTTNAQALLNAINDPKTRAKARDIAQKKGMVVGVFDGATAGIAGRGIAVLKGIIRPIAPKLAAKPVGKLGSWTAEMGIQMGGGMAGEAVGSVAAGQPIHAPSVLIEGFAELGTGAVEVGIAKTLRAGSKDAGAEETTMLRQIKKYLDDGGTVEGAKKIIDDTKIAYEGQLDTASRSPIIVESKEKGKETRVQEFDKDAEAVAWMESEEAEGRTVNLVSKEKAAEVEATEAPTAEVTPEAPVEVTPKPEKKDDPWVINVGRKKEEAEGTVIKEKTSGSGKAVTHYDLGGGKLRSHIKNPDGTTFRDTTYEFVFAEDEDGAIWRHTYQTDSKTGKVKEINSVIVEDTTPPTKIPASIDLGYSQSPAGTDSGLSKGAETLEQDALVRNPDQKIAGAEGTVIKDAAGKEVTAEEFTTEVGTPDPDYVPPTEEQQEEGEAFLPSSQLDLFGGEKDVGVTPSGLKGRALLEDLHRQAREIRETLKKVAKPTLTTKGKPEGPATTKPIAERAKDIIKGGKVVEHKGSPGSKKLMRDLKALERKIEELEAPHPEQIDSQAALKAEMKRLDDKLSDKSTAEILELEAEPLASDTHESYLSEYRKLAIRKKNIEAKLKSKLKPSPEEKVMLQGELNRVKMDLEDVTGILTEETKARENIREENAERAGKETGLFNPSFMKPTEQEKELGLDIENDEYANTAGLGQPRDIRPESTSWVNDLGQRHIHARPREGEGLQGFPTWMEILRRNASRTAYRSISRMKEGSKDVSMAMEWATSAMQDTRARIAEIYEERGPDAAKEFAYAGAFRFQLQRFIDHYRAAMAQKRFSSGDRVGWAAGLDSMEDEISAHDKIDKMQGQIDPAIDFPKASKDQNVIDKMIAETKLLRVLNEFTQGIRDVVIGSQRVDIDKLPDTDITSEALYRDINNILFDEASKWALAIAPMDTRAKNLRKQINSLNKGIDDLNREIWFFTEAPLTKRKRIFKRIRVQKRTKTYSKGPRPMTEDEIATWEEDNKPIQNPVTGEWFGYRNIEDAAKAGAVKRYKGRKGQYEQMVLHRQPYAREGWTFTSEETDITGAHVAKLKAKLAEQKADLIERTFRIRKLRKEISAARVAKTDKKGKAYDTGRVAKAVKSAVRRHNERRAAAVVRGEIETYIELNEDEAIQRYFPSARNPSPEMFDHLPEVMEVQNPYSRNNLHGLLYRMRLAMDTYMREVTKNHDISVEEGRGLIRTAELFSKSGEPTTYLDEGWDAAHRIRLTKAAFLRMKEGDTISSNTLKPSGGPVFSEAVASDSGRAAQWKRIVAAGVNNRLAHIRKATITVFRPKTESLNAMEKATALAFRDAYGDFTAGWASVMENLGQTKGSMSLDEAESLIWDTADMHKSEELQLAGLVPIKKFYNNAIVNLFRMAKKHGIEMPRVHFLDGDVTAERGSYYKGNIYINTANNGPIHAYRTLIHEVIHAITDKALNESSTLVSKEMNALFSRVREQTIGTVVEYADGRVEPMLTEGGGVFSHALSNIEEFIAAAFENPEFQEFLASIPAFESEFLTAPDDAPFANAFDMFVGMVKNLLRKLGVNVGNTTALSEVIRLTHEGITPAEQVSVGEQMGKGLRLYAEGVGRRWDLMEGLTYDAPLQQRWQELKEKYGDIDSDLFDPPLEEPGEQFARRDASLTVQEKRVLDGINKMYQNYQMHPSSGEPRVNAKLIDDIAVLHPLPEDLRTPLHQVLHTGRKIADNVLKSLAKKGYLESSMGTSMGGRYSRLYSPSETPPSVTGELFSPSPREVYDVGSSAYIPDLVEARTASEALDIIIKQSIHEHERVLARKLKKATRISTAGGVIPIHTASSRKAFIEDGGRSEGGAFYSQGNDAIVFSPERMMDSQEGFYPAGIYLHEIAHAATSKAIHRVTAGTMPSFMLKVSDGKSKLSRAEKALANLEFLRRAIELNLIGPPGQATSGLETIQDALAREIPDEGGIAYGLKNVDEFIAEAYSNWNFRHILNSTRIKSLRLEWPFPPDSDKTVWDALVEIISDLLGLSSNESTILEEVMRQSEALMRLPIEEHRTPTSWSYQEQGELFSPPPRESDLTPAELLDKARGHMEPPPAAEPAHGWFSRLYQNFITKSEFAQMMEEKVHETSNYSGIPMLGLREMHELLNGAPQKAFHLVGNFTKAIHDIIGKKREGEFNTYLFLKRADSRLRTDFANQQRLEELNDKIDTSRLRNPEDALTLDEKLELITLEVSSKAVGNWTQQGIAQALRAMEEQHGAETMAKFADAQKVFTKFTDESLFGLVESGRIGLNTYLRMRKSSEFYAPFFVAQYFDATETSILEYVKGIRNADFSLVPIMDATKYKLYNSIMVGEHNKFSLQMSRLAEVDTDGAVIQEFETEDRRDAKIDAWNESVSETIAKLKIKLGKALKEGDSIGAQAIEQEIQRRRHSLKNHPKVSVPDGWRKIDVWEEGRRKNYILKEEYHSAFSSVLPSDSEGGLSAIISPLTDLFKMGATGLNLFFQFFNAILVDPIRIMTSSRAGLRLNDAKSLGINFIMQYFRGFAASMWANIPASRGIIDNTGERGMGKLVQGFIDSGAAGSTISDYLQKEQIRNPLKRKKYSGLRGGTQKLWDWGTTKVDQLNTLGKVLEHTAKLVGYQRLMDIEGATKLSQKIEATKDSEKKAALEKELDEKMRRIAIEIRNYVGSPDFARRGTATEAWQLNLVFMFFNARVQGVERDFHRLGGIVRKGDRSDGIKMALKLTSMAAIPSVLIWAMNRRDDYDEDYDKISPEDRRHYFHIPMDKWFTHPWTGEKVREYIRIPRRETFGLVSYLAEGMLEHMVNEDPKAVNEMIAALAEGIIPVNIQSEKGGLELDPWGRFESVLSSLNPVIKTPIEIVSNRNFYHHGDVIRKSLKAAPAHEQYYNNTPDLYRDLAGIIGASPLRVQHGIRGMTAGLVSQFIPDKDIDDRPGLMKVPLIGGPAKRLFRSKYLNPTDDMRAMEDYVTDSAGGAAVRHRLVDAFWTRTRELNPRDRARAAIVMLSGMEASHDTMLVKRELVKRFREMNLSRDERMLKTLPVEARAGFILDKMMSMPVDERREYWLNLHSKKIVTRDVAGTILRELRPLGGAQALFPSQ